ncbi:MAG: Trm112 family protein [Hyphomicrobium sp.]
MTSSDELPPPERAQPKAEIDARLLELLVCPLTKQRLDYDAERQELISRAAGLAFPIRNGVPLMIEDAARRLDDSDLARR